VIEKALGMTVIGILAAGLVACAAEGASAAAADVSALPAQAGALVSQTVVGELTEAEADGLSFMREEEKLARDVYLVLYEQWDLPVFQNIANSEQTHMDAVLTLLERYGLDDPAAGDTGVFTAPALQALYDELVATGSRSLADALRVGAAIEEIDILDLEERVAQTERADIRQVYENLTNGSGNHLRAFVSTLERQTGETYEPQYLDQDAYEAIASASAARGNGAGASRSAGRGQGSRGSGSRGQGSNGQGTNGQGGSAQGAGVQESSLQTSRGQGSRGNGGGRQ